MTESTDILLKAGMTQQQILAGRMRNVAERMQRDVELAALLVVEGAKVWQKVFPDTPPEQLAEWARLTLQAASAQLKSEKQTAVPTYPEPYDVLIPNQQALVDSLPEGGKLRREQKTLDNMIEEAAAMMDDGQ
ncbi:MAG: hypothetical protein IPK63_15925 [Candidatus Competibacteraceae bacterium]|nr:hypothetical protein [Candidatus Competibacteraceae bacterium]